ncbi:MAG: rRNA pseudouridine synthase [Magnetospirillum sp.]|nr:rRNA pseudouridine synthase [Magnetospirillum sp.]
MSEEKTKTDKAAPEKGAPEKGERIAKRLARAGICSRRDAERWIAEGRVAVNGRTLDTPAFLVSPGDLVVVDGKPLPEPERTRVWRYHKPAGLMTTHKDPEGRPTVFERLPEDMPRVISVGRLDYASEGLLLLTNDGELARKLELPSNSWIRRYRVRVHGEVDPERLVPLEKGITIEGVRYGSIKAILDRQKGANAWVTVSIREGKNREVRRVFEHLGWPVLRLIRVAYGPFQLGSLEEGAVEEVPAKVFKEQLGLEESKWAKAAPDEHPQLPHAPGARKGGRTRPEGGKSHPFSDDKGGKGRAFGDDKKKPHADRRRKP